MNYRRPAFKAPLAISLLLAAFLLTAPSVSGQEPEVPRRPRGPAAGPVIKLPRGEGADEQQHTADAQKAQQAQQAAPLKWEYCTVTGNTQKLREVGLSTRIIPTAFINYHTNNWEEVEGTSHDLAVLNALAKLGEDGWELTGVREKFSLSEGTGTSTPVFYLKRPKRPE